MGLLRSVPRQADDLGILSSEEIGDDEAPYHLLRHLELAETFEKQTLF